MAQATTPAPSTTHTRRPVTGTARDANRKRAPFLIELYRSAVGKKYVMAITGILLMGFVFAHMLGNLKMYLGPAEFDTLRRVPPPDPRADLPPHARSCGCCASGSSPRSSLHIHAAYALTSINHRARPVKYARPSATTSPPTTPAARCAGRGSSSGCSSSSTSIDLTWGRHRLRLRARRPPTTTSSHSFAAVPVAILYIVANLALGLHLFHGAWSIFQTLGWNNPRFNTLAPRLRRSAFAGGHRHRQRRRSRSWCRPASSGTMAAEGDDR